MTKNERLMIIKLAKMTSSLSRAVAELSRDVKDDGEAKQIQASLELMIKNYDELADLMEEEWK